MKLHLLLAFGLITSITLAVLHDRQKEKEFAALQQASDDDVYASLDPVLDTAGQARK